MVTLHFRPCKFLHAVLIIRSSTFGPTRTPMLLTLKRGTLLVLCEGSKIEVPFIPIKNVWIDSGAPLDVIIGHKPLNPSLQCGPVWELAAVVTVELPPIHRGHLATENGKS